MFTVDNLWERFRPVPPLEQRRQGYGRVLLSGLGPQFYTVEVEVPMVGKQRWDPVVTLRFDGLAVTGRVIFPLAGPYGRMPRRRLKVPFPVPDPIMDLLVAEHQRVTGDFPPYTPLLDPFGLI